MRYYSVYKGEKEISFGTLEEIAEKLGVKIETVKYYGYKSYIKRTKSRKRKGINARMLVRC